MEKKENKGLKIVKSVLNFVIALLVILFVIVVVLQRFSNNKLSFFNLRMFTVVSGSMKPTYDIGDVLISKETDASKIKVGDTISYLGRAGSFRDKVITHKVVGIEKDENGKYVFRTKGTANLVEDPLVYQDQLYGVVVYKVKLLSLIYKIVSTKYGMLIFVIIPLFYVIGSEILSFMLEKEEKRRSK
mgnify:FL=1